MQGSIETLLGKKLIAKNSPDYYIIAEIGVNHEGDINLAKKLLELAKEGGADGAKFQAYKAGKIASKHSPAYWDLSKEKTRSQFELFQKYDSFGMQEFKELALYCEKLQIDFLCTAFDDEAVEYLDPLVPFHKIASADLTNLPLLRHIASKKKPVILSTGASSYAEIQTALDSLATQGCSDVSLLHCVLNYPTPDDLAFLSRLSALERLFPESVIGYSDHTLPGNACYPVQVAYLLGARIIEKHFTHDKTLPGNDHYHAMNASDLKLLKEKLETIRKLLGPPSQQAFLNSQAKAIEHARRSIVLKRSCAAGEVLSPVMITTKRPGHGISPIHWDEVIGKTLLQHFDADHLLSWSDLK